MKGISLGLIGCGAMGAKHLENFINIKHVSSIAVADSSEERLAWIRKKCKGITAFKDFEEMLEHVDAVCISTPNSLHFEQAYHAIRKGKHTLVEKPLTTCSSDAEKLVAEATKRKVILAVGFQKRFNMRYQALRSAVCRGKMGKPILIRARMILEGPYRGWKAVGDWWYSKRFGSGALIDVGSHMIDLVEWMFPSPVIRTKAFLGRNLNLPVEEFAFCLLQLDKGTTVILELGWFAKKNDERLEVVGTMGTMEVVNTPNIFDSLIDMLHLRKDDFYFQDQAFVESVIGNRIIPPLATGSDGLCARARAHWTC
jgi:predicted dehydrogenase